MSTAQSIRTARIAHVALWTRDLDRAAGFWKEHFDGIVGPVYASARRPGFTSRFVTLSEGASLELMSAPWIGPGDGPEERCGWAHVALSLGSAEAVREAAARLEALGHLVSAPRTTGDGFYEAVIRDPDGNLIEITA